MLDELNSSYDCSAAGDDLHQLLQELSQWNGRTDLSTEEQQEKNRLENQIRFIRNKCDIPGGDKH